MIALSLSIAGLLKRDFGYKAKKRGYLCRCSWRNWLQVKNGRSYRQLNCLYELENLKREWNWNLKTGSVWSYFLLILKLS